MLGDKIPSFSSTRLSLSLRRSFSSAFYSNLEMSWRGFWDAARARVKCRYKILFFSESLRHDRRRRGGVRVLGTSKLRKILSLCLPGALKCLAIFIENVAWSSVWNRCWGITHDVCCDFDEVTDQRKQGQRQNKILIQHLKWVSLFIRYHEICDVPDFSIFAHSLLKNSHESEFEIWEKLSAQIWHLSWQIFNFAARFPRERLVPLKLRLFSSAS